MLTYKHKAMKRFFQLVLMALAFAVCAPAQAQQITGPRGSDDMKIGVAGFSYRKYRNIDEAGALLKSMEVKYLSVKDWWLPLTATVEEMNAFKAKLAEYGVEGYTLGPIYMRSEADVDKTFAYAQRYGAKMFIGVPNYELIDYVKAKVKETGIKVAIHTHGPDGAAFPDIRTVVEKVKDVNAGIGCCMDLGHTFRSGYNCAEDIVTYKDWIYDIHIKDETAASKEGTTWEMGRGVIDFRPIIKALRQINYQGVISFEFEKNPDNPHPGVAESIGYLRAALDFTK